jgi:hypothetical protein
MTKATLGELDPEALLDEESEGDDASKNEEHDLDDEGKEDKEGSDKSEEEDPEADKGEPEAGEADEEPEGKQELSKLEKAAEDLKKRNEELENPLDKIDDDWEPKSYKELLELSVKVNEQREQERQLKSEIDDVDQQKAQLVAREEIQKEWNAEIESLIAEGRIPKIKDKESDSDEGIKARDDVFRFMIAHNNKVAETGKGYKVSSFEQALDLKEMQDMMKDKEEFDKKQADVKKRQGSMIGGNSRSTGGSGGKPGYVAGTSLDDILSEEMTR